MTYKGPCLSAHVPLVFSIMMMDAHELAIALHNDAGPMNLGHACRGRKFGGGKTLGAQGQPPAQLHFPVGLGVGQRVRRWRRLPTDEGDTLGLCE